MNGNTPSPFSVLGQFLEEDGWYPQAVEDRPIYRMYFSGIHSELRCFAQVNEELSVFLFYAVCPTNVPEERRIAASEYITRANYGLRIGNFEMDFADGEFRFKSSFDFEGEPLSTVLLRNAIYPAVQTMDRYLPGMMKVIYGNKSPADIIAEIEGG